MASAVGFTATIDDEPTSNSLKRRRSSNLVPNETDIEQMPSKRVCSSSITNNSTSDNSNHVQSMFSSLNDVVQSHRDLVREYLELQMCHRPALSHDEQHFIQTEEDLIDKVEKNLQDFNHMPSTPPSRNGKRQRCQSINSTNQSFDRVKHETHILKRIDELKSDGKWTNQRLAKCLEPNKRKTQWDYLLDEMRWLAEDFLLEKRWKQAMAKKISLAVLKYFREKNQLENYQQREQIQFRRKQAQFICREVMNFWKNISRVAEDKETIRLEELRKNQLDFHENSPLSTSSEETIDDEETIKCEEENEPDEYTLYELEELQADQEESLDTVLKRHYGLDLSKEKVNHILEESSNDNSTSFDDELVDKNPQLSDLLPIVQSLQPTGLTLHTTSVQIPVPFLLKHPLRDYQHVGLDWLVRFYDRKLNCILADEAGLGKTIQTIALLAYLACEKGNWGPHLIIVPSSSILNWEIELKKWCPALKIFIDYGSSQEWTNINSYHICLTSYKLLSHNPKLYRRNRWKYLILDEVQNIKDFQSLLWQTLTSLHSERRLLLTNVSITSSSVELRAFMQFLMPNFELSEEFFHLFILRRSKGDVEDQLPTTHEHILMCNLSKRQKDFYENLMPRDSTKPGQSINLLMQLRKVCNHPDLFESRSVISPLILEKELIQYQIPQLIFDINIKYPYLAFDCTSYDTFLSFRIKYTLQATKEMIMNVIYRANNSTYDWYSDQERIQLTQEMIERYRNSSLWIQSDERSKDFGNSSGINQLEDLDDKDRFSRCELLCRINADRCQFRPLYGSDVLSQIELAIRPCHRESRTTFNGYALCQQANQTSTTTADYFTRTDILQKLVQSNRDLLPEIDRFLISTTRVFASPIELVQSNGIRLKTQILPRKPLIEVLSSTDFDVLSSMNHIKRNRLLQFPDRQLIEYDCGKLQILAKLLVDFEQARHRCLIYTQMTNMLGVLEIFLNSHGYSYLRVDGTTDILQRQILIERFNNDKKIFLLILSTRTGGFSVNLTGADTIIFYDSDWNSMIDAQVRQRCQRIGQMKDIHIYRLITKDSIEEKIFNQVNQKDLLGNWTERQLEEALIEVEDEIDRQAAVELIREVNAELNELNDEDIDDQGQRNQLEEELRAVDDQLQPIERYALRCVEAYRIEHPITQMSSNTYLDIGQVQKDWQSARVRALKEEEDKQLEQDDDEMLYTYVRDNERKIWITEDGQAFEIWCGILMKYSIDENEEIYNDEELDFGYESEAMVIEPEEYIRFPLPKALVDTTNMTRSDTNILVPRSLFDRSNLLLNTQSSSLSTNTLNKSKQVPNNNQILPSSISSPQVNIKARQLYVNNGTTTTPLPNPSNTNVIVPASTSTPSRPVKLEEMLSKDNFQGLLEIDNSDWLISEDYKVLDTIQNIQQLPLSSMSFSSTSNANKPQSILPNSSLSSASSPLLPSTTVSSASSSIVNNTTNALTQNWDFISDIVNRYSRVLRTPKQCKHRFEQVIGPREEGRVVYDLIKKKKHVIKGTVKMSDDNWQMLRTNQLFVHDNCQKLVQIYHQKFETVSQFEQQFSSMMYLNKFKQMQVAQAAHHQMRGLKLGTHLQENNINVDVAPLTPGDVSFQRSEREKELKQQQLQQQQQQSQPATTVTANVHSQQQQQHHPQTPTTSNNSDTIKQSTPTTNTTLASTVANTRVRPTTLNTTPTPTPINPSPSTPLSLIPAGSPSTPTIQRSVSSNIIVASNNHPNMHPTRSQSNILPPRTNLLSATPTSLNPIPSSPNPSSMPTATIVSGQRQVQVLPSNNISTNETNPIQQKQVGTVQITSNDYRHVRAVPHQQQTITSPSPSPTPTTLQLRTQSYQRNQAQAAALGSLEVRAQLSTSPKPQQPPRPPSATPRSSSITQPPVDYLIQSQGKSLGSSTSQPPLPVAVVRPMQHPATSVAPTISSSPTSPLNLPSLNVTLPPSKLTTTTATTTPANNPTQQIRAAAAFIPSQGQSLAQTQQIRQLITNANNLSQQNNTQRLTEAAQRSPSNIQQIIASRTPALSGQVRNVRILTFTPGANPPSGITDSTTTGNNQPTSITYNRSNSSTTTFPRSTINIDQDIPPDLAAQLHRLKSFNVTTTDPNDTNPTPRAVLVPARTISGSSTSSTSSVGSTSKIKSSSLIDPNTMGFTAKTSQANIVFQLPPSTTATGGDDSTTTTTNTTNASGLTRQNLMQHLNLISSNINQRSQSPTAISTQTTVNRLLQQCQIRAAFNSSTGQVSSGSLNNEQLASSSPPPPHPPPPSSTT